MKKQGRQVQPLRPLDWEIQAYFEAGRTIRGCSPPAGSTFGTRIVSQPLGASGGRKSAGFSLTEVSKFGRSRSISAPLGCSNQNLRGSMVSANNTIWARLNSRLSSETRGKQFR